jgi:NAD dependent epimerase/dehydratase family enzyme
VRGPFNLTAPNPVTNKELMQALGRSLHRPAFVPTPGFALRILKGKVASMLTTGQRVLPTKALQLGYTFKFPTLDAALADLAARDRAAGAA